MGWVKCLNRLVYCGTSRAPVRAKKGNYTCPTSPDVQSLSLVLQNRSEIMDDKRDWGGHGIEQEKALGVWQCDWIICFVCIMPSTRTLSWRSVHNELIHGSVQTTCKEVLCSSGEQLAKDTANDAFFCPGVVLPAPPRQEPCLGDKRQRRQGGGEEQEEEQCGTIISSEEGGREGKLAW